MSTSATRIRTRGLLDTIGILAIVAGLILGFGLPGTSIPTASADSSCQDADASGNDRGFVHMMLELEDSGGGTLVIDTDDVDVSCTFNNAVSVFTGGEQVRVISGPDGDDAKDQPGYHTSCSQEYQGATVEIGSTQYTVTDWSMSTDGGDKNCGAPQPAEIVVKKVDAEGNGIAGAEFTLYRDGKVDDGTVEPKDGEPTYTCTSDVNGICDFGDTVQTGKYALDETAVPAGYRKAADLPVEKIEIKEGESTNLQYTDPRISYQIDVTPDGVNAVGNAHQFTVKLTADGNPLGGATIDLAWSGVGSITSPGSSCTTDSAGECQVVVNSSDPGSGTLTGTFQTPYQNTIGAAPGNTTSSSSTGVTAPGCADGEYAFAFKYEDGHTDSGCSESNTVTEGIHVNSLHVSCSDDFSGGTADKSDLAGHLVVDYQIVQMENGEVKKACPDTPQPPNPDPYSSINDDATKQWVGYEVEISPDDTNLLGHPHEFTVTVYEVDGQGSPDRVVIAGVDVGLSWSGPTGSTVDTTTCTSNADGQCFINVDSDDNAGTGTLSVETLTGTPTATSEELTVDVGGEVAADKTWREYRALLDDDSVNPVRTTHDFDVQVQYRETTNDSWTNAGADLTVDWDSSGVGFDDLGSSTCDDGTDADGRCTIVVYSDGDGSRDVEVVSVSGASLPDGPQPFVFRDSAYASQPDNADEAATKEWVTFGANIQPTAANKVGEPHTFTVDVFRFDGSGSPVGVPDGTVVNTQLDWAPVDASNEVVENTCATDGTVDDECTITVNTGVGGSVTATVLGLSDYDFDGTTQDITFDNQPSAVKTWYEYRAWIEPDETALVDTELTYYVTAEQNSGDGWEPVPAGTTVGLSDTGLDAIQSEDCSTGTGDDPRTDGTTETNVCTVVTNSPVPGSIDVTVETVSSDDAVDSPGPAPVSADDLPDGKSLTSTKTWVEYFTDIEPDEVALTGTTLTYYVTVTQDDGTGATPVPAGTQVEVSDDNPDITPTGGTCVDGTGTGDDPRTDGAVETNVCTIDVVSATPATVTTSVDEVQALAVDASGATNATFPDSTLGVTAGESRTATKEWVEVEVAVTPDETNIVGEPHTFDVDVLVRGSDFLDMPDGATAVVSTSGVGSITDQTCDSGTVDGTCTVTVNSDESGSLTISVDAVTFSASGETFTVDFTDNDTTGEAATQDLEATKTWRAYRASIVPDGLDLVRNDQPSTVTVEQTDVANPTEADWNPVPTGTTATVDNSSGVGTVVPDAGTCDSTGTDANGECETIANSPDAGTGTFEVTDITVEHPATGSPTTVAAGGGLTTTDTVDKTWAAFRSTITTDAVNITGDEHLFTVTSEYTIDGSTWAPVQDGTDVVVSAAGIGSIIDSGAFDTTCTAGVAGDGEGTTGGDCAVWVVSDTAGSLDVSVDSLTATISAGQLSDTFVVAYGRDTNGDPNPGLLEGFDQTDRSGDGDDDASTKTWASYRLRLNPPEAINLLDGSDDDPEKQHEITAILTSDDAVNAPVGGQTIDLAVDSGATFADGSSATTCTTADDGTCTVVITSDGPSRATVTGSYDASVGDSTPVTIASENDAVKTWTTFRVNVTPDQAVNVVDSPHTFTVTVEQSSPAADCGSDWCAVEDAVPTIQVNGTDLDVDASDCDAGTDAAGQCDVVVTSATVQAITLTATYTESYDGYSTEISNTAGAAFSDSGDKDWIDYELTVDPPTDENLVDTDHVFTVTITTTFPTANGEQTEPVVGAVPDIQLAGPGGITDNACDQGTDANGKCLVTITSSDTGDATLTATWQGTASDDAVGKSYTDSGDKLWVDYALEINPPQATNVLGDPHTFTATLTVDTGEGFGPAAGETLQFTVDGQGEVIGGDVAADLACTTDDAGECDITINSDTAGTTDVGVSYGAEVGSTSRTLTDEANKLWVDIQLVKTAVVGDGFGDGDLLADPETGIPFLSFSTSEPGPKTAVFEYEITNPSPVTLENVVLTDDRLGDIDLTQYPDCLTLDPGEVCTARASEQFDYDDATASLGASITNIGVVTATGNGEEVTDTDDAVIRLTAVQSSILIDLVKDVVIGAGDVEDVDGRPVVTWSQEEYEAGVSKTVRYRFTVTNISNARIVDVELTDPMISDDPLIAVSDGVSLDPNESTTVEADYELSVEQGFPDGPIATQVDNVATVTGANETRDSFSEATDDASVFTQVVFAEVCCEPLPKTGFGSAGLLPVSVLLIAVGAAILWADRRRGWTS